MENGNGTDNKSGQENNAPNQNQNEKIEFSEAQQAHLQKIIDARFGKIQSKHEEEKKTLQEQLDATKAELEALKNGKKDDKGSNDDPKQKQFQDLLNNEKNLTKQAKDALAKKEEENKALAAEMLRVRKEVAMRNAAGSRFHDMEVVMALTNSAVEWDEDTKTWVVRENGVIKQNSSLTNMTLEEYFEEFARKRPYLVSSDVLGGTGASESKRSGGSAMGVVKSKADLKTVKEKSDYITKFGLDAFEQLPVR